MIRPQLSAILHESIKWNQNIKKNDITLQADDC